MLASNVTRETLIKAASEVGVTLDLDRRNRAGTRWRLRLLPQVHPWNLTKGGRRRPGPHGDTKYQRESVGYSTAGRRVHAVCWHGHRDFFRAVYDREPEAIFRTVLTTYKGWADFESHYSATGSRNIGPPIAPVPVSEACRCQSS